MNPIQFVYRDASGNIATWLLTRWKENSRYIQGRGDADSLPRTFRKDRVIEYLVGADQLLFDNAPPAPEPAPKVQPDTRPQVLFTGFKAADRQRLETLSAESGFRVMKTAGRSLAVLCIGYNAGPSKVEDAREAGAFIVTEEQLLHLLKTGEVPC
ncbi:hypothetical protein [Pseudomonas sp. PSE14]|uniref:hypothetical protein n=1 Tax=Pseudomonas sp. PSE14 TaxID=3016341 RepID=UPI0023D8357B|nr:hypothetical protein [Pseudomonas sp. PSE14]WEJ70352.1 hypothetical protein O6P39_16920 [Pseudomonas sp. PSE14]